ncbi:MAG TPA: S9 family peptidase [bacterium]
MIRRTRCVSRAMAWSVAFAIACLMVMPDLFGSEPLSPKDLLRIKSVTHAHIRPDGAWIAYTVSVPRAANDKAGAAYSELYLVSPKTRENRPFITGKVNISAVQWRPDGLALAFLMKRGEDAKTQVWMIAVNGGEARQLTDSETNVEKFNWHPSGKQIAYIAETPKSKREKELEKRGYGFIYYEENLKSQNLYLIAVAAPGEKAEPEQLTKEVAVWSFEFSPDGKTVAAAISEKNLIDHSYMFQRVHLLSLEDQSLKQLTNNPGKLGNYAFSPDGKYLAYAAALEQKDHAVSQAFVVPVAGGEADNLTPTKFRGHINWVGWKDNGTVLYNADEGVETTYSLAKLTGNGVERTVILNSKDHGVVFDPPTFSNDFKNFAFVGGSPHNPNEVYYWNGLPAQAGGKQIQRLTETNGWLTDRKLGMQEAIRYQARDGMEVEGVLIYPVDYQADQRYPLVVIVHGGPESNFSNRWISRYAEPGQVLAGKGYAAFYPNYRASTGYGVEYAAYGYNDAAGVEFDDIADGIDYLVQQGIADRERVGLGGGSYGGFASAWFATYYTAKVKAVCMFVGISDLISKRGTTDIPFEELYVHSGKKLEEMWQQSLERSPIYWAHQSKTATLIYGGADDPRVHPSQSLELYRLMKMNNHPAVRLVQYPGEEHGNRKQPGQTDVIYRILDWYDWYVKEAKPLDGPMPPLDLSERYGLELAD